MNKHIPGEPNISQMNKASFLKIKHILDIQIGVPDGEAHPGQIQKSPATRQQSWRRSNDPWP